MRVMAHSPPNYAISVLGSAGGVADPATITIDAKGNYPPVRHYGGLPNPKSLIGSINGLSQGVYAYGGAQLFVEFMAEMKRPRDFIKAMSGAQFFIYSVYMTYSLYVYHFQGQHSYNLSYQVVSPYGWQVVDNMLAVTSGLIAAGLYGNIGIKVFYNNILVDLCRAPPLTTKKGKWLWATIVPIYWSVAFIVAASIPNFFGLVPVVAAFCVIQFCYSSPLILAIEYAIKKDAILQGEGFDAATGVFPRHENGIRRWSRGFWSRTRYINVWHVVYAGGALATAGLGAYAAITSIIDAFENPQINAFTCQSPLKLAPP